MRPSVRRKVGNEFALLLTQGDQCRGGVHEHGTEWHRVLWASHRRKNDSAALLQILVLADGLSPASASHNSVEAQKKPRRTRIGSALLAQTEHPCQALRPDQHRARTPLGHHTRGARIGKRSTLHVSKGQGTLPLASSLVSATSHSRLRAPARSRTRPVLDYSEGSAQRTPAFKCSPPLAGTR